MTVDDLTQELLDVVRSCKKTFSVLPKNSMGEEVDKRLYEIAVVQARVERANCGFKV